MATASDLPIELHAEIVRDLNHFKDRRTLLSTALVSKNWCKGSQRILFGTFTDHYHDNLAQEDRVRWTHMRFLKTIVEYPQRLGPLVRSYAQASLASNPAATWASVGRETIFDLWRLTAEALPAMVNLQHLNFQPEYDCWPAADDWVSSSTLLHSFNFQLETLMWMNFYHPRNGLSDFLRTQHNLIHLENGHYPDDHILPWLEDGVCARLMSVSGGYGSLIHIARRRKIIAWKCDTEDFTNVEERVRQDSSALDSVMYLSVCNYKVFRTIVGPLNLNIILLKLTQGSWGINTIAPLANNMPNLRVLALIQSKHRTIADHQFTQSAVNCFGKLPCLEYIIHRTSHQSGNEFRCTKLSLAPDSTDDILREQLGIYYDVGAVWWTIYNV